MGQRCIRCGRPLSAGYFGGVCPSCRQATRYDNRKNASRFSFGFSFFSKLKWIAIGILILYIIGAMAK